MGHGLTGGMGWRSWCMQHMLFSRSLPALLPPVFWRRHHHACVPSPALLSGLQVLHAHLELPRCILGEAAVDYKAAAAMLQRFAYKRDLR